MSDYTVNGKTPLSAWVPSRDTSGNGTTTLTDLSGSRNMTLTNFALSGSTSNWVADTGSGGVRCLDFDGTNDYCVSSNYTASTITSYSISCWAKRSASQRFYVFGPRSSASHLGFEAYETMVYINHPGSGAGYCQFAFTASGNWNHYVLVYDGSLTGNSNRLKLYIDGTQRSLTFFATWAASFSSQAVPAYLGYRPWSASYSQCRLDDIRFFSEAIDLTDVSYLYGGGTGRGIIASAAAPNQRRHAAQASIRSTL